MQRCLRHLYTVTQGFHHRDVKDLYSDVTLLSDGLAQRSQEERLAQAWLASHLASCQTFNHRITPLFGGSQPLWPLPKTVVNKTEEIVDIESQGCGKPGACFHFD